MCLRGLGLVSAMTIVAEIHDFSRFHSPRQLMAYLGLVPSEYSSGGKQSRVYRARIPGHKFALRSRARIPRVGV
jgi:transposase